jgi:signal transduction histidine kinase
MLNTLDINDYWPKTAISPHRMRTILTGLVRSFRDINELRAKKELLEGMQARLIQQEKLKVLGELASGVVHDFRNVLTPITAYSSMLHSMPDLSDSDRIEFAGLLFQASLDAAMIVERLQRDYLGKSGADDRGSVDVGRILADTTALARPKLSERCKALDCQINFEVQCEPNVMLVGNAGELRQGLLNLTLNALDAMQRSGTISLRAFEDNGDAVLQVIDSGDGMDENTLAQCQSAFFTTKGTGGTGLGLATTVNTVHAHGGELEIESEIGVGTTVEIRLPIDLAIE